MLVGSVASFFKVSVDYCSIESYDVRQSDCQTMYLGGNLEIETDEPYNIKAKKNVADGYT